MRTYNSFLTTNNSSQIVEIFRSYKNDPSSVDSSWNKFFQSLEPDEIQILNDYETIDWDKVQSNASVIGDSTTAISDTLRMVMMIKAFRDVGHLKANLDPLALEIKKEYPELTPEYYGFYSQDMNRKIFLSGYLGYDFASPREVYEKLTSIYSGTLATEYKHLSNNEESSWLKNRLENKEDLSITKRGKRTILERLIQAEQFEMFLDKKYRGTKRFGLDGSEATIPALEQILKRSAEYGIRDFAFACAHRGRLNILANVIKKPIVQIFSEFIHGGVNARSDMGSGDVKYHLGASSNRSFSGKVIHVSMAANPSHLEAVNPVVVGKIRAKQTLSNDKDNNLVSGLLIHGDAAIAGQGVVAETFTMSQLNGYRIGGLIHFIINNQIGFTTSPQYGRSAPYASEIAKIVQCPIFHVNGDDPEAVILASRMATEFKNEFKKDTLVDMFCYRKHGHNEGDEPMFTQPLMYKKIKSTKSTTTKYEKKLIDEGVITQSEVDYFKQKNLEDLEDKFEKAKNYKVKGRSWMGGQWSGLSLAPRETKRKGHTSVQKATFMSVGKSINTIPKKFDAHAKISKIYDLRKQSITKGKDIDWATAEAMAFGTLLKEGYTVRLAGQDSGRGTFSHRHSVLYDQNTEDRYIPLNNIPSQKKQFEVVDSFLSEFGVLGFEYGYSLADPNALVLWEAQFGDFANGAQIIIDQFISASERKWMQMSGLVLLLPHGHEGMGPEHSSARIERFLQLCAEDNMQIVNCTSPANYFHVLRRQLHRKFRKPLIIFTPKSALRHPFNTSDIKDFVGKSSFHRVLTKDVKQPQRVIFCSGKIYFELKEHKRKKEINNVQIVRVEQIYPFPYDAIKNIVKEKQNCDFLWVQEEPKNMGPWNFVKRRIGNIFNDLGFQKSLYFVGRKRAAAPATGITSRHNMNQELIMKNALEAPLKNVIKEKEGVSGFKFKFALPRE